jgi:TrmH family RNA methyltransferase
VTDSTTITSAANPLAKRVRALADRKHRRREGVFVVDGIQPVWRAVQAGSDIETLIVAPELLTQPAALRMVEEQEAAGTHVARMSGELFLRLSDRDGAPGLAAIVRSRMLGLADLSTGRDAVFVALHEIGNPGNLGTIIRAADATGAAGVVLIGDTSDPFAPAAVRASMGSLFAVDVAHTPGLDGFFDWAQECGIRVVATSGYAAGEHWDADYPTPLALLLGSEGPGLPPAALERSQQQVRIPMVGTAESLNLSVAASVLLYEVRKKALRGKAPGTV